jgi:hypothetical protein
MSNIAVSSRVSGNYDARNVRGPLATCRGLPARDPTGPDNRLHITQERQLSAADADNGSAVLASMCPRERDRPFAVDDPRHIGCFDIRKCIHGCAVIGDREANASYENQCFV